MITFLVSGLWHGASYNFIIWGALNGLLNILFVLYKKYEDKKVFLWMTALGKLDRIVINFIIVSLTWIPFRANTIADVGYITKNLFCFRGLHTSYTEQAMSAGITKSFLIVFVVSLIILLTNDVIQKKYHELLILRIKSTIGVFSYTALLFILLIVVGYYGPTMESPAFIYIQF